MADVEEKLKRIEASERVVGTFVVNTDGIPIRSTLDNSTTVQHAGLLRNLTVMARNMVRDLDPQNDLTFFCIRSRKNEIMVGLAENNHLVTVIQNLPE